MHHTLLKKKSKLNFLECDCRNLSKKITAFLLRSNIALRNIARPRKCVNTNFYFSRTENTYKIRNCFSVIKIHFSQSLKQYHSLSSARTTMDVNYHWKLVFAPGGRGGVKNHNFATQTSCCLGFWFLNIRLYHNRRLSSVFQAEPTKAVKTNQVLTYFEVRQKLSPTPPGGTSFCGMFRMVSLECECLVDRALIS